MPACAQNRHEFSPILKLQKGGFWQTQFAVKVFPSSWRANFVQSCATSGVRSLRRCSWRANCVQFRAKSCNGWRAASAGDVLGVQFSCSLACKFVAPLECGLCRKVWANPLAFKFVQRPYWPFEFCGLQRSLGIFLGMQSSAKLHTISRIFMQFFPWADSEKHLQHSIVTVLGSLSMKVMPIGYLELLRRVTCLQKQIGKTNWGRTANHSQKCP